MPVFGDVDCDEYVYYVEGIYLIPQGYIFCDSIPVFEGGYFIYDEFNYPLDPTYTTVNFSGHLYITNMALFMSNPGLIGQFLICDAFTGALCPAKVTIQYRAPMLGMMCNFIHCIDEICDGPCTYERGDLVPIKSCMTLQFPTCYDDCSMSEYILNIILPGTGTIFSDTIYWDSAGINLDYCLEYDLLYYQSTNPCYLLELESNCGHYCLSSICIDKLEPCNIYAPFISNQNNDPPQFDELEIFPNPNNGDVVNLKAGNVSSGGANVIIYRLDGSISLSEEIGFIGQNGSLQTVNLTPGTYIISVQDKVTGVRAVTKYVHMD